jgi:predicted phage terminase large subunit-like protein
MRAHGTKTISVEINGIGNAFPEILRKEAEQIGMDVFVRRVANRENKTARILDAIEPLLDTGRLYAHERVRASGLIDEMDAWSPDEWTRDDGLDALAGALRAMPAPVRPQGFAARPIRARTEFKIMS